MADESDYFRAYARDVGLNPLVGGFTNVQDALAIVGTGLAVARAHLVAADLLTLFSAPPTIVPAAGVGTVIVPVQIVSEWKPGLDTYEVLTPAFAYNSDRTNGGVGALGSMLMLAGGAQAVAVLVPLTTVPTSPLEIATSVSANQPITLSQPHNGGTPGGNPLERGPIVTSTLAAGGTGYAPGDTGTIDFDGIAAYTVDTVGALGVVLTYHLTNDGDGYDTTSNPLATTAVTGIGTGLTLNVTAVPPADGDLYVTVLYTVLDLH